MKPSNPRADEPKLYAKGGEVDDGESGEDDLMDHVALEAIHAVHNRDHQTFRSSLHALVAQSINQLNKDDEKGAE